MSSGSLTLCPKFSLTKFNSLTPPSWSPKWSVMYLFLQKKEGGRDKKKRMTVNVQCDWWKRTHVVYCPQFHSERQMWDSAFLHTFAAGNITARLPWLQSFAPVTSFRKYGTVVSTNGRSSLLPNWEDTRMGVHWTPMSGGLRRPPSRSSQDLNKSRWNSVTYSISKVVQTCEELPSPLLFHVALDGARCCGALVIHVLPATGYVRVHQERQVVHHGLSCYSRRSIVNLRQELESCLLHIVEKLVLVSAKEYFVM